MKYSEFKSEAVKTESVPSEITINPQAFLSSIRLAISVSEVVDAFKKKIFYTKPVDHKALLDHLAQAQKNLDILKNLITAAQPNPNNLNGLVSINPRTLHGVVGFYTEAAELLIALDNSITWNVPIDKVNLNEEVADAMWYAAILEDNKDINLEDAMEKVIKKLRARYPDKFTSEKAIKRDLKTERKILEGGSDQT